MGSKKKSRAEIFGEMLADVVSEAAHMTYNAPRGVKIVKACINRLEGRVSEILPREANPAYRQARYGKKGV